MLRAEARPVDRLLTTYPRLIGLMLLAPGLLLGAWVVHGWRAHLRMGPIPAMLAPSLVLVGLSVALLGRHNSSIHCLPIMAGLLLGIYVFFGLTGELPLAPFVAHFMEGH